MYRAVGGNSCRIAVSAGKEVVNLALPYRKTLFHASNDPSPKIGQSFRLPTDCVPGRRPRFATLLAVVGVAADHL